jgi:hypothetical protein
MWRFYFAYCEAGFLERHITDVHLTFAGRAWRRPAPVTPASLPASV